MTSFLTVKYTTELRGIHQVRHLDTLAINGQVRHVLQEWTLTDIYSALFENMRHFSIYWLVVRVS